MQLTGYPRDKLEGPEDPDGPEGPQVHPFLLVVAGGRAVGLLGGGDECNVPREGGPGSTLHPRNKDNLCRTCCLKRGMVFAQIS